MSFYVSLSKKKFKHFKKALGAGNPCIFLHYWYMFFSLSIRTHYLFILRMQDPQKTEEGIRFFIAEVTGSFELPQVDAGVFWKCS